ARGRAVCDRRGVRACAPAEPETEDEEDEPGVEAGDEVVEDDAPAAGDALDLAGGPGFDDVREAEEKEAGEQHGRGEAGPGGGGGGEEQECDRLSGGLIGDHLGGVLLPESGFGLVALDDARGGEYQGQ